MTDKRVIEKIDLGYSDIGRLDDIYDFFDDFNKCIYLWKASNSM